MSLLDERPVAQFPDCFFDLFAGIHDEGTIGEDGFLEGRARNEHESNPRFRPDFDLVAVIVEFYEADGFYNLI